MRVTVKDNLPTPHAQAGQTLDLPDAEAKDMIERGTAVPAGDEPRAVEPTAPASPSEPEPAPEAEEPEDPKAKPRKPRKR